MKTSACAGGALVIALMAAQGQNVGPSASAIRVNQDKSFVNFETPHVHPLDLSPNGQILAACGTVDARVELFDVSGETPRNIGSVSVGMEPVSVRFRDDNELWVTCHVSDNINIINVSERRVSRTLPTADEPTDVVFAGQPKMAYITCSQVNKVQVFDMTNLDASPQEIAIEGEDPRSLATSPDGRYVYAAIFESGNGSTILGGNVRNVKRVTYPPNIVRDPSTPYKGETPSPKMRADSRPPLPDTLSTAPRTSLIVKKDEAGKWKDENGEDWSDVVSGERAEASGRVKGWDVVDQDLAIIDTTTRKVNYTRRLMTTVMGIDVNPSTGDVTVIGTDAKNELRFESNLNGRFLRVNQATVRPTGSVKNLTDLNPHLNYESPTVPASTRKQSIGDPRAIRWNSTGEKAYIAGMGSNNVVVINREGTRASKTPAIPVGEGPTGLALDESRNRLFVLNRFDASISTVDLKTEKEISRTAYFDSTPPYVKTGRRMLFDTHATSGTGHVSCASCHVDGRMDRLAWDLGDPSRKSAQLPKLDQASGTRSVHPMKGPMVTLSFQGIMGHEPFHWTGDRKGLEDFAGTFTDLQGRETQPSRGELDSMGKYLATLHFPPNPNRQLNNELPAKVTLPGQYTTGKYGPAGMPLPPGDPRNGEKLFHGTGQCVSCHSSGGGSGDTTGRQTGGAYSFPQPLQTGSELGSIKISPLRNLLEKVGFEATQQRNLAGFGFNHDGTVDSLARYVSSVHFGFNASAVAAPQVPRAPASDQEVADMVAFLISNPMPSDSSANSKNVYDVPAATGMQYAFADLERTPALEFKVLQAIQEAKRNSVDIVVRGTVDGRPRGWTFDPATAKFVSDEQTGNSLLLSDLQDAPYANQLSVMVVPRLAAQRLAMDRDQDGLKDGDETRDLVEELPGVQNPLSAETADASGDNYSWAPDGKPDAQNDFDGDGIKNADEIAQGSNFAYGLAKLLLGPNADPYRLRVDYSPDSELTLRWTAQEQGTYEVESSSDMRTWKAYPNGRKEVGAPLGRDDHRVSWSAKAPPTPSYFRVRKVK